MNGVTIICRSTEYYFIERVVQIFRFDAVWILIWLCNCPFGDRICKLCYYRFRCSASKFEFYGFCLPLLRTTGDRRPRWTGVFVSVKWHFYEQVIYLASTVIFIIERPKIRPWDTICVCYLSWKRNPKKYAREKIVNSMEIEKEHMRYVIRNQYQSGT